MRVASRSSSRGRPRAPSTTRPGTLQIGRRVDSSVTTYALRRLLIAIPTLLVISLVVFSVLALAPGDPLSNLAGSSDIPFEVRENIRKQFGLDQPIYIRYFKWLAAYVQGDWG